MSAKYYLVVVLTYTSLSPPQVERIFGVFIVFSGFLCCELQVRFLCPVSF